MKKTTEFVIYFRDEKDEISSFQFNDGNGESFEGWAEKIFREGWIFMSDAIPAHRIIRVRKI